MIRNQRYDPDRVHELEKVARMFLKEISYLHFDEWGDAYACTFCDGKKVDFYTGREPFEHTPDCYTNAIKDLLTGIKEL